MKTHVACCLAIITIMVLVGPGKPHRLGAEDAATPLGEPLEQRQE